MAIDNAGAVARACRSNAADPVFRHAHWRRRGPAWRRAVAPRSRSRRSKGEKRTLDDLRAGEKLAMCLRKRRTVRGLRAACSAACGNSGEREAPIAFAGDDRIGAAVVVAEFDQERTAKRLHDGSTCPRARPSRSTRSHDIGHGSAPALVLCPPPSQTQHVTNRGRVLPPGTIQIWFLPQRSALVAQRQPARHRAPIASAASSPASAAGRCE